MTERVIYEADGIRLVEQDGEHRFEWTVPPVEDLRRDIAAWVAKHFVPREQLEAARRNNETKRQKIKRQRKELDRHQGCIPAPRFEPGDEVWIVGVGQCFEVSEVLWDNGWHYGLTKPCEVEHWGRYSESSLYPTEAAARAAMED